MPRKIERPKNVFPRRKKVLDKQTNLMYKKSNSNTYQTNEAEVKLQAHPQRVPGAVIGAKSGAANGPPRAGRKGETP